MVPLRGQFPLAIVYEGQYLTIVEGKQSLLQPDVWNHLQVMVWLTLLQWFAWPLAKGKNAVWHWQGSDLWAAVGRSQNYGPQFLCGSISDAPWSVFSGIFRLWDGCNSWSLIKLGFLIFHWFRNYTSWLNYLAMLEFLLYCNLLK